MYYDKTNDIEITNYRRARPNISFPVKVTEGILNSVGIYTVTEAPIADEFQNAENERVELIDGVYTKVYDYIDKPIEECQQIVLNKLKAKFNSIRRPRVPLTLEDGTAIEIDGGREDKDNFKEESDRLLRNNLTDTVIKDADNVSHPATQTDVYNGYVAIVDNFASVMQWKWAKEAEIDGCTTIDELKAVVI